MSATARTVVRVIDDHVLLKGLDALCRERM